jgi:molybdate transport system substrate-binding protein
MNWLAALAAVAVALVGSITPAGAVELIVLSSTGMQAALTDIRPIYEKKTHNKLAMTFLTANQVKDKIAAGAAFDVAIVLPPVTDQLVAAGKIEPGIVPLAKSGLGIAFKEGATAPDVSTPDAFKAALLNADSVAFTTTGQSGLYLARLLERWDIADQVKAKATAIPSGSTASYVVKGQADMAIQLLAELHAVPGVQIFPFPAAVQNFLKFQGSVSPTSKHKKTGASFLKFLSTPAAVKVLRAKYMEPGN